METETGALGTAFPGTASGVASHGTASGVQAENAPMSKATPAVLPADIKDSFERNVACRMCMHPAH